MTLVRFTAHPDAADRPPGALVAAGTYPGEVFGDAGRTGRTAATIVRRDFGPYAQVDWDDAPGSPGATSMGRVVRYGTTRALGTTPDQVLAGIELVEGRRGY